MQHDSEIKSLLLDSIIGSELVAVSIEDANTGLLIDVNTGFARLFRRSRNEIVGNPSSEFLFQNNQNLREEILQKASAGESLNNIIIEIEAGGQPKSLTAEARLINSGGNEFLTIIATNTQSSPAARNIALENIEAKQAELDKLKLQFISMISHELRNPLTTILLSTDMLKHYGDQWSDEEKSKQFDRIKNTILNMTQMMERIVILSKIESGKMEFNPEVIDLPSFCLSLTEHVEFVTGSSHSFELNIEGDFTFAKVDENLFGLIINNLLTNAVKYSSKGSVVKFEVLQEGGFIKVVIQDTGIGIPKEEIKYLFQPFYRATNVKSISGYGLGLSIVKKCVDAHFGTIEVKSYIGKGTTFIARLPFDKNAVMLNT